ncbi:MAG: sulfatase-like hydrolase/transferase [Phycisphaerae bacterium]|nr:sulfatase-like hydrolase/transferase [Phycisphaerae bacterium]
MGPIHRRSFLKVAGLATCSALAGGCCGGMMSKIAKSSNPNFLFILIDDLNKAWVSPYGNTDVKMPHLDRLAAQGLKFNNFYSMPQCTPTRTTLLTGQYPFHHGWVNHWDVPRWGTGHFDEKHNMTFARTLRQAGYKTAVAGKWQINDFRREPDAMTKHGFDDYCMWTGYEAQNPPSSERYWNPYIHTNSGSKTCKDKFGADVFTDFLINFMKENKNQPMAMYFPMALTHGPNTTTPTEKDIKTSRDKFKAMIRYTDLCLGRLVEAIENLGIRRNTIIIWTTDNGASDGMSVDVDGHKVMGGKAKLTENGTCQPFIVSCPGLVPQGIETDALSDLTDIYPTFAELAGLAMPKGITIDGVSLAKVFKGEDQAGPRKWILSMGGGAGRIGPSGRVQNWEKYANRVIRDKRYKLFIENGIASRLHDLQQDRWEENNLIGSTQTEHIAAKKRLQGYLDTMPKTDANPKYDSLPAKPWDKKASDFPATRRRK